MENQVFKYPVNYVAITQKFEDNKHYGLDLGWNEENGGKNQPVYSAADGIVYTLYAHLKNGIVIKKGASIKQGDLIGYMGNTGAATGNHLHFEIYRGGTSTKYRVNPIVLTYVFDNQITSLGETKDIVKYHLSVEPVLRDKSRKQIKILKSNLRIRREPNLKAAIITYANKDNIYNVLETVEFDNYKWHKIGENSYIAEVADYVEISSPTEEKYMNIIVKIIEFIKSLF